MQNGEILLWTVGLKMDSTTILKQNTGFSPLGSFEKHAPYGEILQSVP